MNKVGTITADELRNQNSSISEPDWLKNERALAQKFYSKTSIPSSRDEEWRNTKIDSLKWEKLDEYVRHQKKVNHSTRSGLGSSTESLTPKGDGNNQLEGWIQQGLSVLGGVDGLATISNSHICIEEVSEKLTKHGVIFCDWLTAYKEHADLLKKYTVQESLTQSKSKFAWLNLAEFNNGLFLYVPDGVVLDKPVVSVVKMQDKDELVSLPRITLVASSNSRVQFVQLFLSGPAENSESATDEWVLSNSRVEIYVESGAQVDYVELQSFNSQTFAVGERFNTVGNDGTFSSTSIVLGAGQLKTDICTNLKGRGAYSKILGVALGDQSEYFSFNTIQEHNSADTKSDINFRVALKDASTSIYQGIIRIAPHAQRSDAFQSNKNLILGSKARADSIPKLEILADDVKCSHAATMGPVDREQMFYLMSRGLDQAQAEELVVNGFFKQTLEACPVKGLSEWMTDLISEKISRKSEVIEK